MNSNEGLRACFDGHAPICMQSVFTGVTLAEVLFLLREVRFSPGAGALDLGGGPGRHSFQLAHKGVDMLGTESSGGKAGKRGYHPVDPDECEIMLMASRLGAPA